MMMQENDPRVEALQKAAWGLQSLGNKPGSRLPDAFKRETYKLTSKALNLCSDAQYTEEADFMERSKGFVERIDAKRLEVAEVEEFEKAKVTGKCYRPSSTGTYVIDDVTDRQKLAARVEARNQASLTSTAGGARTLTAKEVVARLTEDPEFLALCDWGLGDSDVEPLCQGLKSAGANLASLDVSHNLLADVGVQRLVSALASGSCPKLKELYIGFNSFGDLGDQMLKGGLKALRKNLVVHLDDAGSQAASSPAEPAAETGQELAPSVPSSAGYCTEGSPSTTPPVAAAASVDSDAQCTAATETSTSPAVLPTTEAEPVSAGMRVDIVKAKSSDDLELHAVLSLPEDIAACSDLDVDVSPWRIVIRRVSGELLADTAFPCAVIADTAQAVFSRKRRTMTMKLQPSDPAAAVALHGSS